MTRMCTVHWVARGYLDKGISVTDIAGGEGTPNMGTCVHVKMGFLLNLFLLTLTAVAAAYAGQWGHLNWFPTFKT